MNKPILTLSQIIRQLDSGFKWIGPTISFSFATEIPFGGFPNNESTGLSTFSSAQQTATRRAMELWSDVIDIDLVATTQERGQILLINYQDAGLAYAYFPSAGDIFINPDSPSNIELDYGQYGFETLIHEIGHTLGLSHPGDYNGSNGDLNYQNNAEYQHDSRQYSVMSYWDALNTGADHEDVASSTPLLHDIAAIQAIYGANNNTRTGDTVYGFNSTADRAAYQFSTTSSSVFAIWDSAGNDTLNASGYTQNALINLSGGSFSSIGGLTDNISIAFNVDIENAVGGSGHDILSGNSLSNALQGGSGDDRLIGFAGNDLLDGGSGNDTAVFSDNINQYNVFSSVSSYQISGVSNTDTLMNIEMLRFADTVDLSLAQALSQLSQTNSNDISAKAQTITAGSSFQKSTDQNYIQDFYKITALINGPLDLQLSDINNSHQLNVYDNQLNLLSANIHSTQLITTKNQTYFIEVVSQQSNSDDYQLTTQYTPTMNQSDALLLSITLFNAVPGSFFLEVFNESLNSGMSLSSLAKDLVTTDTFNSLYAPSLSNSEFSHNFIDSLTANETSTADKKMASNWVADQLDQGASHADTMLLTAMLLKNFSPIDAQWGLAQQALTNKIDVAKWFSLDKSLSYESLSELQAVIEDVTSDINSVAQVTGFDQSIALLSSIVQSESSLIIVGANPIEVTNELLS
jgi:serralysin